MDSSGPTALGGNELSWLNQSCRLWEADSWGLAPLYPPAPFPTSAAVYLGPTDEADRTKASSKLLQGLQACLDHLRVTAQAQVVVGTEVKDF